MTYLWRDIDAKWWKAVRCEAKRSNVNVRELLQSLVEDWLRRSVRNDISRKADAVDPSAKHLDPSD